MLQPKRVKFRRQHKGCRAITRVAQRGYTLAFGTFGLKALEGVRMSSHQLESVRVVIMRAIKRSGLVWRRIFPDKPITKKPIQVRMGGGKGNPEFFVAAVKAGTILYELEGVSKETAERAFFLAGKKLSIKTRMVIREDYTKE